MSERKDLTTLQEVLEAMLLDNETITARAVTRRPECPFRHASDITRNAGRTQLLGSYKVRQAELRNLSEKTDKQSRTNLTRQIAQLEDECNVLRGQRDTLIASHRAMLLAIGEAGGMHGWARFFKDYRAAIETLRALEALPSAMILPVAGPHARKSD